MSCDDFVIFDEFEIRKRLGNLTQNDQSNVLEIAKRYSMSKYQHIVIFTEDLSLLEKDLKNVNSNFQVYQTGLLSIGINQESVPETSFKRTKLDKEQNMIDAKIFQLNREKLLDLVVWVEPSADNNPPKITSIIKNLTVGEQDRQWHRSFASNFEDEVEITSNLARSIYTAKQMLDNFEIKLEPESEITYESACQKTLGSETEQYEVLLSPSSFELAHVNEERDELIKAFNETKNIKVDVNKDLTKLSESLKNKHVWHIAGHMDIEFQGKTGVLATDKQLITDDRLVELCKVNSVSTGHGSLQIVFLNGCKSLRVAERIKDCGIPHVICWSTNCTDKGSMSFAEAFWKEFISISSKHLSFDYKISKSFENAKRYIQEDIQHSESDAIQKYSKFVFEDPLNSPNSRYVQADNTRPPEFYPCAVGKIVHLRNPPKTLRNARKAKLVNLHSREVIGSLSLSPLNILTLSGLSRERALIPHRAKSFAFCHPPSTLVRFIHGMNGTEDT